MKYEYIGWIPCVSGELFFSKTEQSLGSYDFYLSNFIVRDCDGRFKERLLVSSSVVDLQDTEFFKKPNKGLFRIVVVAESRSYKSLEGSVYFIEKNNADKKGAFSYLYKLFPRKSCSKESLLIRELSKIQDVFEHSNGILYEGDQISSSSSCISDDEGVKHSTNVATLKKRIDVLRTSLSKINKTKVHRVEFHISSNGLTLVTRVPLKTQDQPKDSKQIISQREKKLTCAHAYYYLKFLLHKHVHHAHENDSLTTVHRVRGEANENAEVLTRDIKRGLVDARRTRKYSKRSVTGMAAYGDSLVRICESLGWWQQNHLFLDGLTPIDTAAKSDKNCQSGYLVNVATSIELLKEEASESIGILKRIVPPFTTSVLFFLAVLGPSFLYLNAFINGLLNPFTPKDSVALKNHNYPDFVEQFEKHMGPLCPSKGCSLFTSWLEKYASGQYEALLNAFLVVVVLALICSVMSVNWKRISLTTLPRKIIDWMSKRAVTFASGSNRKSRIGLFLITLVVIGMHAKRALFYYFRPKKWMPLFSGIVMICLVLLALFCIYVGLQKLL